MATNKLGTLVYDLVVDTKDFQKGLVRGGRELTALKKLFLDTRTPVESLGLQFDGMRKLIKEGAAPLNAFSRSIADLAVNTKGGGREARKFAEELRNEGRQIVRAASSQKNFNKEKLNAARNLIRAAEEIENEVNAVRKSKAEHLRAAKAKRESAKETGKLTTATNSSSKALTRFGSGMALQVSALAKQISAISAAYAVINQARAGFAGALELGRSTKEFEIFTGSAETSLSLMSDIRDLAAETPLTMGASTQTVRTLLQYGTAAQDVMTITRQLGDISGGSTERMQRLALAMGQITANGRLQGQELRQLVESGFNPLQVLSEQLNVSMLELRVRMAEGAISADDVASALKSATSEGGRFANALERIGNETAFGQIQKLRGEFEKLRDEIYGPATEVAAGLAAVTTDAIRAGRQFVRIFAKGATKEAFEMKKKATLAEALLGAFTGDVNLANVFGRLVIANLIEVERRAIEMEQAQVEAAETTQESYNKVNESIVDRIAKLRQERQEIVLGKDEYFIANAERLGASGQYIEQLRQELDLTNKAREADEKRIKASREAEERAKERQRAEKKAIEERRRQIEQDRKEAQALIESVFSPLEKLEQQMEEIQRLAKFLTPLQRVKLMDQALEAFNKQEATETTQAAAAVTRGSVEEFKLIAQINSTQVDQQQKHHNEAQDQRKRMNKKLDKQIKGIDMLPLKLGEELSELMPTAVGSSPASGGGFFGPRRGPEAYN